MATPSSRGRTSSTTTSSPSSKSTTTSSTTTSSPSTRGNISGSSSPSGSISGVSSSISGSSSVSAGSSYGGFGPSAPSSSVSSSASTSSGSISGGGSNTISVSNYGNPSFSSSPTSSTISSSGNISSLGRSPFATVSSPNTGLAAFGLQSLQSALISTSNQLGQGFQTSNQIGVAATAARLGAALSSFIGPINPLLTPPQALILDRPPVQPQPFTVIDFTPESKTTAGDIPKDSKDIPTTLTQNIIKYTPYLILAGIIYAGISLVKN